MVALPLSILALAAGVYLLIKVNREYLGGLFKFFAWLIIVLAVISTAATVFHGVQHLRGHHGFHGCEMREEHVMFKDMHGCPGGPGNDNSCPMASGKMTSDSVILDRAMCEKMMGKDSCDKLCKERGQCIMTKNECAKMCGGKDACCKTDMKACCKPEQKEIPACCKDAGKDTKACCKK